MIFIGADAADDVIRLSIENDIAYGLGGNDWIGDVAGSEPSDDWMWGGFGDDTLYSSSGSDLLFGGVGDDRFQFAGGDENVLVRGGRGDDTLYVSRALFAPGEIENLVYAKGGAIFELTGGGRLDVRGIEHVVLQH